MDRSRVICLVVVIFYVLTFIGVPLLTNKAWDKDIDAGEFFAQLVGGLLTTLGFVCIWWSDFLGNVLWAGRGAWDPKPSTSGGMKILGWLFLILAFSAHVIAPLLMTKIWGSDSGSQLRMPFMKWLERY